VTVTFREATKADLPFVIELLSDDYLGKGRERSDPEQYRSAFDDITADPNNALIVGVAADKIVACYQLTLIANVSLSATKRAQIEGVRVDSSMRGQGVGSAMLADAERRARSAGAGLIQLTMNKSREDAHRFYEANGFAASHIGFKKAL